MVNAQPWELLGLFTHTVGGLTIVINYAHVPNMYM